MKMKRKQTLAALACAFALVLAACGEDREPSLTPGDGGDPVTVTVGASPAPHAVILEQIRPLLLEQGVNLKIVEFDDYVMPNLSLEAKELDANYFQHRPYLDDFNARNGTRLVAIAPVHYEPLGIYAGKCSSLDALPEGARIGIPVDNTNGARALQLLVDQGIIGLREGAGLEATEIDIEENPKHVEIVAMDSANLPASLPDFDLAVINGNYALGAGLDPGLLLAAEAADSDAARTFSNVLCVREGDENRPEILKLKEALCSDTVRRFLAENYRGSVVPSF